MKITKKIIRKSAEFLNTIPDDQWTKFAQERENGTRCAIGHLALNPESPLYSVGHIMLGRVKFISHGSPAVDINIFCEKITGLYIVDANNHPETVDENNSREGSVKLLKFLAEII